MRTALWTLWCWHHRRALRQRWWARTNLSERSFRLVYDTKAYFEEAHERAEREIRAERNRL